MVLQKYPSKLEFTFLLLVALLPIINWLLHLDSFPHTHEWLRPFVFVKLISESFQQSHFAISWLSEINGGYGYPTFVFYPIIFFYVSALFKYILHLNEYHAVMLTVYCVTAMALINLYYLLTEIVVEKIYIWLGVILYVMIPYHYSLLYIRGDYSEFLALSMLPMSINMLMKYQIYESIKFFTGFVIAVVIGILAHPIFLTVYFPISLLILVYFILWGDVQFHSVIIFLGGVIIALVITSYYWLNFLLLIPEINIKQAEIDFPAYAHTSPMVELVNMIRGSHHFSQVGFLYLLMSVITFIQWDKWKFWIFGACIYIWMLSMTREFNEIIPIWSIPLFSNIQYPWRMLGAINLVLVLFIATIRLGKKTELILNLSIYGILLVSLQFSNFYAQWLSIADDKAQLVINKASQYPNSIDGTMGSISNEYASKLFLKTEFKADHLVESVFKHSHIQPISKNNQAFHYQINSDKEDWIRVNRMQLSNWIFTLDEDIKTPVTQNGIYYIFVSKGQHQLSFEYSRPFNLSMYLVALIIFTLILYISYYVHKFTKKT